MMKLKKLSAILLAVMMLAVCATAWADTTLGDGTGTTDGLGEQGVFASPDAPTSQNKTLILEKEIRVYNLDESTVHGPTITYSYAVAPATVASGTSVTDNANKHDPQGSETTLVKQGIGNLSATVYWANDELDANTDGTKNVKDISLDFNNVIFTGAGVYRYTITESLAEGFSYDNTGVTETTGNHVRYIDVYVKPADTFTDGSTAAQWDIYGFTCFTNNESITDANKSTAAVKTTGFVDGTTNGTDDTAFLADQYYTYNLTISKTVVNDNYAKATHEFPFTVIFSNSDITKNILLDTTEGGTVTDFTHDAGAPAWSGVAKLKDGGSIKYIGIPMGTDVEVYETNDVSGTTYKVLTTRTNATEGNGTDAQVTWGSTPTTAAAQAATKPEHQSTKSTIDTTKNADDDNAHSIAITNTLVTISPTGLVFRYAPYLLIMVGGIALMIIAKKHKKHTDEE